MSDYDPRVYGTEQDRVNCTFFTKMGACRHGEKCDRRHNRPTESPTVLFPNMYTAPPQYRAGPHGDIVVSEREMDEAFEEFYVDVFAEFSKTGAIEELNVCANPGAHLAGNVYLKFANVSQADDALKRFSGRLYDGKPLRGELCPVADFSEARCRQFSTGSCDRRMCNFLHLKEPNSRLQEQLYHWQLEEWKKNRHLERPPPGVPPMIRERYGYGGGGDRYDERRGGYRREGRRDRRYEDRGPRYNERRGPPPRDGGDYPPYDDSDPFGRDMRSAGGPGGSGDPYQGSTHGGGGGAEASEREIEAKLAQVRNALAAANHPSDHDHPSRKRDRPDSGFDNDGPDAKKRG